MPISHRWRRFRYLTLPYLAFGCTLVTAVFLWREQGRMPNGKGVVEAVRIDVATATSGLLVDLEHSIPRQWALFEPVQSGTVIARLDDAPIRAAVATLEAESAKIRKEVIAARARVRFDNATRQHDRFREANRLAWETERHRLDVLDREMQIEVDEVDLQRRNEVLAVIRPLVDDQNSFPRLQYVEEVIRRDRVAERIKENREALAEAKRQEKKAVERLAEFPELLKAEIDALVAPVRALIDVQQARINELRVQSESLLVRAPISGIIVAVHAWPGQAVAAGDPVVTIASQRGRYIVSYVRQQQRFEPCQGMPVDVRIAGLGHRKMSSSIQQVGPQVELVPSNQLTDPTVPEWGLPVRIAMPDQFDARPGTKVELTFDWSQGDRGG